MKKILIISASFYPMNDPRSLRTTELVKEYSKQGHEVTIITRADERQEELLSNYNFKIKDIGKLRYNEIQLKGKGLPLLIRRFLKRFSTLLVEFPEIQYIPLVGSKLKNESGYDLMISIGVPHPIHWGVAYSRSRKHTIAKIWIADCGDPYYGQVNDTFKVPFYFKYIENWAFGKADYISIPFEGAKKGYTKEVQSKIKIIPQGFTFPILKESNYSNLQDGIIRFAYAGNIGSYRHYAIPFLEELKKYDIHYKFYIYTKEKDFWLSNLPLNVLEKCEIKDYLLRDELLQDLSKMDFLLHFPYKKDIQRSLKIIDYIYLNKPILSYRNENEDNVALKEFLLFEFNKQMKKVDLNQFKIANVCQQFLSLTNS